LSPAVFFLNLPDQTPALSAKNEKNTRV